METSTSSPFSSTLTSQLSNRREKKRSRSLSSDFGSTEVGRVEYLDLYFYGVGFAALFISLMHSHYKRRFR